MRRASFFLAALLGVLIPHGTARAEAGSPREPSLAVVRRVTGDVRMERPQQGAAGVSVEVKAGDLPDSGAAFRVGSNGFLALRFHPDFMQIEARPGSRFEVGYARADTGVPPFPARRIAVAAGGVAAAVSREGPALRLEDGHSLARTGAGRIAFATDARASTVLVIEGEAEVFNRATGTTHTVGRGGKAVSGREGTTVTRAAAGELAAAGLRQNLLEIDFWNPVTEDFETLEVEYESRP